MRWLTDTASTAVYDSLDDLEKIHGHGGSTVVRLYDAPFLTITGPVKVWRGVDVYDPETGRIQSIPPLDLETGEADNQ